MSVDAPAEKQLLGLWMTGALVVGSMIGAGIFLLPVSLAPLGLNAIVGWLISSVGALCIAFSLATLTRAGGAGIQAHIERAFGPNVAYLVTWSLWCSYWAGNAALAIAIGSALSWISPALAGPSFVIVVATASVVVLTLVNARGARAAGGMSVATVAIKLIPLVAVIAIAILRRADGGLERLPAVPLTLAGIATAVALTLFALTGFETATTPVDKVRDPSRTLPLAIMGGTLLVALLYLASSGSIQLLLPIDVVTRSGAPYADAIATQWGRGAASLAAVAIAISAFGCLNGAILATGELGYSMALRGELPAAFAKTRGANTPVLSQLLGSSLTVVLILANSSRTTASLFTFVILLATAATLVLYGVGALAAWKQSSGVARRAAIIVALLFVLFAFYGAGFEADAWGLVLLAIGIAVRVLMRTFNSRGSTPAAAAAPAALRE
ncbi:MAG: amino acid permease [Sphingomicrobium sp.]